MRAHRTSTTSGCRAFKVRRLLAVSGIFLAGALTALGVESAASRLPERTVSGEVVDLSCYLMVGARGPAHRGCGQASLAHGSPAAILLDDGSLVIPLYEPKSEHPVDLAPYMAQRVVAKGVAYAKGGVTGMVMSGVTAAPEPEKPAAMPEKPEAVPEKPAPEPSGHEGGHGHGK